MKSDQKQNLHWICTRNHIFEQFWSDMHNTNCCKLLNCILVHKGVSAQFTSLILVMTITNSTSISNCDNDNVIVEHEHLIHQQTCMQKYLIYSAERPSSSNYRVFSFGIHPAFH